MRLFPTPRYNDVPELLDDSGAVSEEDLRITLRDIRRANIFGLGTWVIKHHLASMLRDVPVDRPLRIIDLATGSGDIPEELCRWAAKRGRNVSLIATDISEPILRVAKERVEIAGFGGKVQFVACDATHAPFDDGSFDVALCSLAFHHLNLEQAHAALREMNRLIKVGFIVNDVYRSQGAWYIAWLLTRLTTNNNLTRHDGPASVLRAFTPRELERISRQAGVPVSIHKHPFWRVAMVGTKGA